MYANVAHKEALYERLEKYAINHKSIVVLPFQEPKITILRLAALNFGVRQRPSILCENYKNASRERNKRLLKIATHQKYMVL